VGSKTIKVNFSEPINTDVDGNDVVDTDLKDAFQLNNGSQFVKEVTFMNNNTQANVEFYTSLEEGTQTIKVSNDLEDYAGYSVVASELEVEVVEDTEAPELVDVKNVSPLKATLVFNEDIESGVTNTDFYHTNTGETADTATVVNGNTVELTFTEANALPNGTAYIYVKKEAVVDLWGNDNSQQLRVAADVEADETAPSVQKVEASAQNELTVTFDEEVDASTGSYTLLDEDGEELDLVGNVAYAQDANSNDIKDTIVVTLDSNVYGDHSLVVDNVEDVVGNAMDSDSVEFFVQDATAPAFSNFSSTLYKDGETTEILVVDFGEEMSVSGEYSVLDLDKYMVNGSALADADSAKITATDKNSKVRIEVKKSDLNISAATDGLEIARVADAAGNKTPSLSGKVDVDAASFVGVKSVEATANNKVQVTLDDLVTDFDANDFDLTASSVDLRDPNKDGNDADSEVVGATIDNSGSTSVITFTLAAGTIADNGLYGGTTPLTVSTVSQADVDTVNSFGEKVSFVGTASDKISGELALFDHDGDNLDGVDETDTPKVKQVEADQGSVTLTFTEDVNFNTISALSFSVQGQTVETITKTASNVLTLNLKDTSALLDTDVTVSQEVAIKDSNGNTIEGIEADVATTTDSVQPTVSSADSLDIDADGNVDTLKVTFSENVDDSSLSAGDFGGYTVAGLQASVAADTADDSVVYLEVTGETGTNVTTTLTTTASGAITDLAGNDLASGVSQAVNDSADPLVTSAASAGTIANGGSVSISFSEALSASAQTDVSNALDAATTANNSATYTIAFNVAGDTVTITEDSGTTTAADDLTLSATTADIEDAASNTNASAQIVTN